jgi:hypothetical protein
VALLLSPSLAEAQFLRLGPFDFTATTRAGAVYSDNIEQERSYETDAEREDYYVFAGVDLQSVADLTANSSLTIDTGVMYEKHFIRDDLDNSEEPFGRFRADYAQSIRHLTLKAFYGWERESESREDTYIPGGRSSKTRNVGTTTEYGTSLEWSRDPFLVGASYDVEKERFDKEEFKDGEKDTTTYHYYGDWKLSDRLTLEADREDETTETPDGKQDGWKLTDSVDLAVILLKKPSLTYKLGYEKESTDKEDGKWEPTHTIDLGDGWVFESPRVKLTLKAAYTYEKDPEEDDVTLTYGATLDHELAARVKHGLSFEREPRDTFGANEDTDTTTYGYYFNMDDVLIPDLDFRGDVTYEIDKPVSGPEEKTTTVELALTHTREISARFRRIFRYEYSWEDSNLESEVLTENRVEWSYEYDL